MLVGEATVFVSHSWAAPLDALVACVREADAALRRPSHPRHVPGATPYFWVDLVVNDQFAAPSRPFAWWQTVFRESVERIGHTVVALEWENPRPLGRIWCLWEMFCSTTGAEEGGGGGVTQKAARARWRALLCHPHASSVKTMPQAMPTMTTPAWYGGMISSASSWRSAELRKPSCRTRDAASAMTRM